MIKVKKSWTIKTTKWEGIIAMLSITYKLFMTKVALGFDKWLILQEKKPFTQLNLKMDTAAKLQSLERRFL